MNSHKYRFFVEFFIRFLKTSSMPKTRRDNRKAIERFDAFDAIQTFDAFDEIQTFDAQKYAKLIDRSI